ncbi:hypothetical protein HUT06_14410 [Actinomadura sp. NAK00032]|uniref:hypothetical protein n=1 Tax=Actinomadura sp. NAK00032 TaxID=2742128 RepID=UPI001592A9B8|nr:hypothetical protein [Actinomadura sp. NAK00032]QKW35074.1 hypothetical protein HUT06_14410 [Actinomadura sp. NAK00032]
MRRPHRVLTAAAACAALAGCGIRPTGILPAGEVPTAGAHPATVTVYLVHGDRLRAVSRPGLPGQPHLGIDQLNVPPTARERAMGLRTEVDVPLEAYSVIDASGAEGAASAVGVRAQMVVRSPGAGAQSWSRIAMAQVVCTAQAVPGIERVTLWKGPSKDRAAWTFSTCDQFADLLE